MALREKLILFFIIVFTFSPLTIFAQEEQRSVNFSATINPQADDLELDITADRAEDSIMIKGDEVTFTISYRSLVESSNNASFPLTLVAYWEEGTIEGSGGTIDVFDYVINSATDAHDGTEPVVNLLNKTITWDIPSLTYSANPHEVSFTLKVKESLVTTELISTYVYAEATFADSEISPESYHLYVQPIEPSPTPTPTPTNTPTPTYTPTPTSTPAPTSVSQVTPGVSVPTVTPLPSATPTPTQIPTPTLPSLKFETVSIPFISSSRVQIQFKSNIETTGTILYNRCDANDFGLVQTSSESSLNHVVNLTDLEPNTNYCFRIQIQSSDSNQIVTSDIFIFQTAEKGSLQDVENVSISSNTVPLISNQNNYIIVPRGVLLTLSVAIENTPNIERVYGFFQHQSIKGISDLYKPNIQQADFIEVSPGIFATEILSPEILGDYRFVMNVSSKDGNLLEQPLPYTFSIVDPLKVIDKESGEPVQHAYVEIKRLEESTGKYKLFNNSFRINQFNWEFFMPYYTNELGELPIPLPQGKYQIEVHTIRYEKEVIEWEINPENTSYPTIVLTPQFSFINLITYISFAFKTVAEVFLFILQEFIRARLFQVVALILELLLFIGFIVGVLLKIFLMKKIHEKKYKLFTTILEEMYHLYIAGLGFSNLVLGILTWYFVNFHQALPFIILLFISGSIFAIVQILEYKKFQDTI